MSRFQQILRSVRFMFSPYRPLKRPVFFTDRDLLARQMAQRDLIGEREIRPVLGKRLIEDQSEYHGPIG